jgi:hypothetical protein
VRLCVTACAVWSVDNLKCSPLTGIRNWSWWVGKKSPPRLIAVSGSSRLVCVMLYWTTDYLQLWPPAAALDRCTSTDVGRSCWVIMLSLIIYQTKSTNSLGRLTTANSVADGSNWSSFFSFVCFALLLNPSVIVVPLFLSLQKFQSYRLMKPISPEV